MKKKIKEMEAKKQQLDARVKEKERKARTKRLIEVGALIEKHFEIQGEEEALKMIYSFRDAINKNKDRMLDLDIEMVRKELKEVKKGTKKREESKA